MKAPKSLKINDVIIGSGPCVESGEIVVCHCVCRRSQGEVLFASSADHPYEIHVGKRGYFRGIECGLLGMQVGGQRTVKVPPNLTYEERSVYPDIPEHAVLFYELTLIRIRGIWQTGKTPA